MKNLAKIAFKFIWIKEIGNNEGFSDPKFSELMHSAGFKKGDPWRMTFVKVCVEKYLSQINTGYIKLLRHDNIFNAGSQLTFNNIKKHYPSVIVDNPTENTIVVWQKYKNNKPTIYGHGAILNYLEGDKLETIDGNTNNLGSREGDMVMQKSRPIKTEGDGLRFKGFISIDNLIKSLENEIQQQLNRC